MNPQHLQAFLWLRWRLRVNQLRRGGVANAVLLALMAVGVAVLAVVLAVVFFFVGLFVLASVPPWGLMYVWDGLVLGFLFCWMIGLVSDLQRADALSLDKVLHLPVSPAGAFLINYVSSLLSVTLIVLLPAMVTLSLGLVLSRGPALLVLFPLLAAFVLAVTALTYQFQGWLAALMVNPRRRRTVIVFVTLTFVLICQLPNLVNILQPWKLKEREALAKRLQQENAETFRKLTAGEIKPDEAQRQLDAERRQFEADTSEVDRQVLEKVQQTARLLNLVLPPGWLALGAAEAAEGNVAAGLLGTLALALIGAASLGRAYGTTLRLYRGQFTSGRRRVAPVPAAATGKRTAGMLDLEVPRLPGQAVAIGLAGLRSLLRAPEAKIMLAAPLILAVLFGSMLLAHSVSLPVAARPLVAFAVIWLTLICLMQVAANQFGFDRGGFRVLVLSAAPRGNILLGKNLALAPLAFVMAGGLLVLLEVLYPLRLADLLATLPQMLTMYLLFSLVTNLLSILAPMPVAAGSFKPSHPRMVPILLHLLFLVAFPLVLAPTLLPLGVQAGLEALGWLEGWPVYLVLALGECVGVVCLYRLLLPLEGRLLQAREQAILTVVTSRE